MDECTPNKPTRPVVGSTSDVSSMKPPSVSPQSAYAEQIVILVRGPPLSPPEKPPLMVFGRRRCCAERQEQARRGRGSAWRGGGSARKLSRNRFRNARGAHPKKCLPGVVSVNAPSRRTLLSAHHHRLRLLPATLATNTSTSTISTNPTLTLRRMIVFT